MGKVVLIVLLSSLSVLGNDTLNVKASFTFSSRPSKFYQEPKFLEIEITNNSHNDFYFVNPFMKFIINDVDTVAAGNLTGDLAYKKDINQRPVPIQKESYTFRKAIR